MNRTLISNSGPIFRLSTFRNEDVLISEPLDHIPSIRIYMVIICFIIGIITLINLIITYIKYQSILKHGLLYRLVVPLLLLLNILIHVAHYTHNIYDPAAYFEPKRLYLKKFFAEMEKTFLFNFPLSIVFLIATGKLLLSSTNQPSNSRLMLITVTIYSLMSMVSGGHYTFEPPKNFSLMCNVTIAGETIVAFLLLIVAIFIHSSNSKKKINYRYTRLNVDDKSDSNVHVSINRQQQQQQQFKSKLSDDE